MHAMDIEASALSKQASSIELAAIHGTENKLFHWSPT